MIGIFDSGFGGLSILKSLKFFHPEFSYIYLGDNARAPYGNRPMESVYRFTKQGVEFLFDKGCPLVLLACNTASAEALHALQHDYGQTHPDRKVLGVIVPAVEEAVRQTRSGRIGVIATQGTVASQTFVREFRKYLPQGEIFQKACPLLVSLVETGEYQSPKTYTILEQYLTPLLKADIDTLVLGCTHYEYLKGDIKKIVGSSISIVSEADIIGSKLSSYLKRHPDIESKIVQRKEITMYTTGREVHFKNVGSRFFDEPIIPRRAKMIE